MKIHQIQMKNQKKNLPKMNNDENINIWNESSYIFLIERIRSIFG